MIDQSNSAVSLYLASKSPRRRELLEQIGVDFSSVSIDVPELRRDSEAPNDYVTRLACSKSRAGFEQVSSDNSVVMGADTVVIEGQHVLEKPSDPEQGLAMLMHLSGRRHSVLTAVALAGRKASECVVCKTDVFFRLIKPREASAYWATGEPIDKAGGYGIQGYGAIFVERIEGSYSNVVGLPLYETSLLLAQFGIPCWQGIET